MAQIEKCRWPTNLTIVMKLKDFSDSHAVKTLKM